MMGVDKLKRIIYYPAPNAEMSWSQERKRIGDFKHGERPVFRGRNLTPRPLNSVNRIGAKLWVIPWVGKSICNTFF
ncbi:hypothetical protein PPNK14_14220 [Pectobacterium parmentieri]